MEDVLNANRLRVLVLDDEEEILDLYKRILSSKRLQNRQDHLKGSTDGPGEMFGVGTNSLQFDVEVCQKAQEAVATTRKAIDEDRPFAVAFLDVRLPNGPDGVWAAEQIRDLDPYVNITMMTGYLDVNAMSIASHVPPPDKLLYLQKPINPQEIYQFAMALGSKWNVERQLRRICHELKMRVEERTEELTKVNEDLNEANRVLHRLTITDDLTKLYNKRYFNQEISDWVDYSQRYEIPLSLLMFDIDNFKNYNDTHGHLAGDKLLEQIGDAVRKSLRRQGDTPFSGIESGCRYGGEEFAIILPRTDFNGAAAVAERLRVQVEEETPVTISIGVAQLGSEGAENGEDLIKKADNNLYKAKEEGRNRVCC